MRRWSLVGLILVLTATGSFSAEIDRSEFPANLRAMEWREVGPYRGGRSAAVAGIAADRETYYFGSTGGGVWKTGNSGQSWSDRGRGIPDIPANALVIDPKDSNRVFVATDDGVWRTDNSGGTWRDFSNGLPNAVVGDILLHPPTRRLRVGTRSRGIWELQL